MKYSFSSLTMKRWTGLPFHSISTLQIRARQPVFRPGQGTDAPVERTWNLRPSESSIHLNFGSLPSLSTTLTVTGVIFAPKESHGHREPESCPMGARAHSWLFRPIFGQGAGERRNKPFSGAPLTLELSLSRIAIEIPCDPGHIQVQMLLEHRRDTLIP